MHCLTEQDSATYLHEFLNHFIDFSFYKYSVMSCQTFLYNYNMHAAIPFHMQQSEVLLWFIVENIVVTKAVTLLYLLFI